MSEVEQPTGGNAVKSLAAFLVLAIIALVAIVGVYTGDAIHKTWTPERTDLVLGSGIAIATLFMIALIVIPIVLVVIVIVGRRNRQDREAFVAPHQGDYDMLIQRAKYQKALADAMKANIGAVQAQDRFAGGGVPSGNPPPAIWQPTQGQWIDETDDISDPADWD